MDAERFRPKRGRQRRKTEVNIRNWQRRKPMRLLSPFKRIPPAGSGSPQRRFRALTLLNQAASIPDLVRICFEEHENHDTGDRNVEPNGERQACDSAVHREPARQREKERGEHHRQRDDRKDYVAG
jgi:hypothetical protein